MGCHGSSEDGVQCPQKLKRLFLKFHLSINFDLYDMEQSEDSFGMRQHATVYVCKGMKSEFKQKNNVKIEHKLRALK